MMTSAADLLRFSLSLSPHSSSSSNSSSIPLIPKRRRNDVLHPYKLLSPNFPNRRRSSFTLFAKAVDFKPPLTENSTRDGAGDCSTVLLDVTGMMCGACVSRVRSILSSDDRVDSVVVNMLTETAAIKLKKTTAEAVPGDEFAKKLTECGFPTKMRESGLGIEEKVKKWKETVAKKEALLVESRNRVTFAWTLVALCCGAHATHILHSLGIHVGHGKPQIEIPL